METDANWQQITGTTTTNSRSNTQAHGDTYSWKIVVDGVSEGIQSDTFTTQSNFKYLVSFWIYPDDIRTGGAEQIYYTAVRNGDDSGWATSESWTTTTVDKWIKVSFEYTESSGGAGAYLIVYGQYDSGQAYTYYVDDVSISESLNGYRIEPVTHMGHEHRKKLLKEIYFNIENTGDWNIDVYHRGGSTVGEVLAASWTNLGTVSCNSSARPYLQVNNINGARNAKYHQIKWGNDRRDEPFQVGSLDLLYEVGERI